jgi:signal transduction histidine kinase
MAVESLVEPIRSRLADRAFQSGMELVVEPLGNAPALVVRANPSAVEQILFNLVDNACKYAAAAADKRIHLVIQSQGTTVQICVRDHGPGIPRAGAQRLFHPFAKSAREAADSAPGVGLGLALSKRLARGMGAHLDLDSAPGDGARFKLTLTVCSGFTPEA